MFQVSKDTLILEIFHVLKYSLKNVNVKFYLNLNEFNVRVVIFYAASSL
jgi:hypothetical protein